LRTIPGKAGLSRYEGERGEIDTGTLGAKNNVQNDTRGGKKIAFVRGTVLKGRTLNTKKRVREGKSEKEKKCKRGVGGGLGG